MPVSICIYPSSLINIGLCCDWTLLLWGRTGGFSFTMPSCLTQLCPYKCQEIFREQILSCAPADKVFSRIICSRLRLWSRQSIEFPSVMVSYTLVSCSPAAQWFSHHPWPGSIISKSHYMALCSLFPFWSHRSETSVRPCLSLLPTQPSRLN